MIIWNFVIYLLDMVTFKLAFEINNMAIVFGLTKTLIFEHIRFASLITDALGNEAYISKGLIIV